MRYDLLAQEAMRGVIRLALGRATSAEGLPGEHHFYITFVTAHPSVDVPRYLREEYPDEMTIVIKRHFWALEVGLENFSVDLSFHGKRETIRVAYDSVIRFLDPEAQYVLQFPRPDVRMVPTPAPVETPVGDAQVFSLDAFRKR